MCPAEKAKTFQPQFKSINEISPMSQDDSEAQLKKDDVELLDRVLDQIFPDPEIRDYMLMFTASCLSGEVDDVDVIVMDHFFTGTPNWQNGANGKDLWPSIIGQSDEYWKG